MAVNTKKSVGFKVVSSLPSTLEKGSFYWVKSVLDGGSGYVSTMYFSFGTAKSDVLRLDLDPNKLFKSVTSNGNGTLTFKNQDAGNSDITTFDLTNDIKNVVTSAIGELNRVMVFKGVYNTGVFPTDAQTGDIILQKDGNEYIYTGSSDSDTDSDGASGWSKFGDQQGIKSLIEKLGKVDVDEATGEQYISVTETGSDNIFRISLTNVSANSDYSVSSDINLTYAEGNGKKLVRLTDLKSVADKAKTRVDTLYNNVLYGVSSKDSDSAFISVSARDDSNRTQTIDLKIAEFETANSDSDYYDGYLTGVNLKSEGLVKGSDIKTIINDIESITAVSLDNLDSRIGSVESGSLKAKSGVFSYNASADIDATSISVTSGESEKFPTSSQVANLVETVADDICNDMKNLVTGNLSWDEI